MDDKDLDLNLNLNNKDIYNPNSGIDILGYIEEQKKMKSGINKNKYINIGVGIFILGLSVGLYFMFKDTIQKVNTVNTESNEKIETINTSNNKKMEDINKTINSKNKEINEEIVKVNKINNEKIKNLETKIIETSNTNSSDDIKIIREDIKSIKEDNRYIKDRLDKVEKRSNNSSKYIEDNKKEEVIKEVEDITEIMEKNIKVCGLETSREECEYKAKLDEKEYYQMGKEIRQVGKKGIIKYTR